MILNGVILPGLSDLPKKVVHATMISTEKLVFIQLHKCASSYIAAALSALPGYISHGKHRRLCDIESHLIESDRIIVTSVRNPWEWYVSLWAYGCLGKGSLFSNLTSGAHVKYRMEVLRKFGMTNAGRGLFSDAFKPRREWHKVYSDVDDPSLFRKWLHMVLSEPRRYDLCDFYAESPASDSIGLYTFRCLHSLSKYTRWLFENDSIRNFDELRLVASENLSVDQFIRVENLREDLLAAVISAGHNGDEVLDKLDSIEGKSNSSVHREALSYYDSATYDLVENREKFIVDMHSYSVSL